MDIASLHHELLQIKQVILDVLISLEEFMFAVGLLKLEVLQSDVVDSGLLVDLQLLDLISSFNHSCHG